MTSSFRIPNKHRVHLRRISGKWIVQYDPSGCPPCIGENMRWVLDQNKPPKLDLRFNERRHG